MQNRGKHGRIKMKEKFKKMLGLLLAFALIISGSIAPSTITFAADEAVAYISFATGDWAAQYWNDGNDYAPVKLTTEKVTGYGQYTVSADVSGVESIGLAFLDVEISNGEALFPNSFMQIDAVKINGEDVTLASKTYTTSDDEVTTRTNLFNEWVTEITEGRTLTGGLDGATASPVDRTVYADKDIKNIEVTFTLKEGKPLGASVAYVQIADSAWSNQYWFDGNDYAPVVANNVEVTGYGQYTVSLDFSNATPLTDVVFLDVEVKNGEINYPFSYMNIDSVKINGEAVTVGNTFTNSDNKQDTRTNLFNTWVGSVTEGRTNGLALSDVTATPIDEAVLKDISSVEVTFTLMEGEEPEPAPYELPSEFNAFMMFSDVSGAWESYASGTPGDTKVTGDGTYTVFLKASDVGATGKATEGQVFLIDIEQLGVAMKEIGTLTEDPNKEDSFTITDLQVAIKVWVDGQEVKSDASKILKGDIEGNGRFRLELYNAWGTGTADMPVVTPDLLTPADEIKVEFTLTGTGIKDGKLIGEATSEEPTTEATTEAPTEAVKEETGDSTMIILIAVGAIILIAAVFVLKNKKK